MKKLNFLATLFTLSLCSNAYSTTINDSLRAAYQYNPDFLKTVANVEIQKEQSLSALSKFLPNISFQSQRSVSKDRNPATKNTLNRIDNTAVSNSYQLTQNLFNGGSDYAQLMSSQTLITSKEYSSLDAQQQVFLKVIQSHLNVIGYKQIVQEYQKNLTYLDKTLRAEQEKFDAGLTKMTDLATTKANLESGKAQLAKSIAQLEIEEANYKTLTGIDPIELESPDVTTEVQDSVASLYAKATQTNLALKASKTAYDASEIMSKAAFSSFMPDITFQYQYSKSSNSNNRLSLSPYSKSRSATANINIPIFQGGVEYAQYRTAKLQASQSRLDYIATLANTESISKQAWFQFNASKIAFKAYQEASKASKTALEGMNEAYNEGLVSITDLLTTLKDDVNNNINLINAQASLIVYYYQTRSVTGDLTAEALGLNDELKVADDSPSSD